MRRISLLLATNWKVPRTYTIKMQPCGAYWDYQGGEHTYYIARMEYYMDEESGYDDYNITWPLEPIHPFHLA